MAYHPVSAEGIHLGGDSWLREDETSNNLHLSIDEDWDSPSAKEDYVYITHMYGYFYDDNGDGFKGAILRCGFNVTSPFSVAAVIKIRIGGMHIQYMA